MIADVSGKGVPAALLMAFLRASLRAATHIGLRHPYLDGESELPAVGINRDETSSSRRSTEFSTLQLGRFRTQMPVTIRLCLLTRTVSTRFIERGRTATGNVSGDALSRVLPYLQTW